MVPRKGSSRRSSVTRRKPVPASTIRLGGSPSCARATDDVWPPYLTNSRPGAGVDPRTPHKCTRMWRSLPAAQQRASRGAHSGRSRAFFHGGRNVLGLGPPERRSHGGEAPGGTPVSPAPLILL